MALTKNRRYRECFKKTLSPKVDQVKLPRVNRAIV